MTQTDNDTLQPTRPTITGGSSTLARTRPSLTARLAALLAAGWTLDEIAYITTGEDA